jgi:hypothetical protein
MDIVRQHETYIHEKGRFYGYEMQIKNPSMLNTSCSDSLRPMLRHILLRLII